MGKHSKQKKLHILKYWYFLSTPIVFFIAFFFLLNIYFINKSFMNVYFLNRPYSGFEKNDILSSVHDDVNNLNSSKITFVFENKVKESKISDLGISFDEKKTTEGIFNYCRSTNFLQSMQCRLISLFSKRTIKPVYSIDFLKLNYALDEQFADIDKKSKNAGIIYNGSQFVINSSAIGLIVDRSKLVKDISNFIENAEINPVELQLVEELPNIEERQLSNTIDKLKKIEKKNISFVFGYDKWNLKGTELVNLFNFDNFGDAYDNSIDLSFLSRKILLSEIKSDILKNELRNIGLDDLKVGNYISNIAKFVDRPKKDAGVRFENGRLVSFSAAMDGQLLEREKLKNMILTNVLVVGESLGSNVVIDLPVVISKAKITNSEINSLGISERIGSGVSYFAGSIPNRVSNINLGSKLISGSIVAPGETFSFVNLVGPVSAEQGFKQAYVINKGKTVLDDGGGICQVSTTVFRAALNAGLPILKRTAHAYRVGYYEQQGFKPGLDATIFSPSVDFQFKNDTAKHILIQGIVDVGHSKLQVDVYGTSDGRRVELGNVLVSNVIPAPEPLYQDDLTLPMGTVKQVEHAANGATTVFSRKVYKNDQIIIDENFRSVFRPWQAVYLVGKG